MHNARAVNLSFDGFDEESKLVGGEDSQLFSGSDEEAAGYWEDAEPGPVDLDEDVYALTISDLSRDFERCGSGNRIGGVQISRIVADLLLIVGCIVVQMFLLKEIKQFVTAKAVHDIRIAYGHYEMAMYGNDTAHCDMTTNGFCRGKIAFFNPLLFSTLDEDIQAAACRIPLSQPLFAFIVLWIWTTTCLGQFAKLYRQFISLIWRTEVTKNPNEIHKPIKEGPEAEEGTQIIYRLTRAMKIIFCGLVFLPRALIISYLLWLGCRWLLATNSFGNLILNAVALEFILQLGEIIYAAMVPERNKHDLSNTKLLPTSTSHSVGYQQLGYILGFNFVSCTWVIVYMWYLQQVLPDYRWDVHEVCVPWIRARFAV